MFLRLSNAVLRPLAILGLALLAITVFFQMASTNMGFSLARLAPNFDRLNPIRKLKDMPGRNMGNLFQAVVMIPVMFWLTWSMVKDRLAGTASPPDDARVTPAPRRPGFW